MIGSLTTKGRNMDTVSSAVDLFLGLSQTCVENGYSPEEALDLVTSSVLTMRDDCYARRGLYASGATTERVETATFLAAVAEDVRDNTFRPSVGRVRDYLLASLTSERKEQS